jgi:hypothetical protein
MTMASTHVKEIKASPRTAIEYYISHRVLHASINAIQKYRGGPGFSDVGGDFGDLSDGLMHTPAPRRHFRGQRNQRLKFRRASLC